MWWLTALQKKKSIKGGRVFLSKENIQYQVTLTVNPKKEPHSIKGSMDTCTSCMPIWTCTRWSHQCFVMIQIRNSRQAFAFPNHLLHRADLRTFFWYNFTPWSKYFQTHQHITGNHSAYKSSQIAGQMYWNTHTLEKAQSTMVGMCLSWRGIFRFTDRLTHTKASLLFQIDQFLKLILPWESALSWFSSLFRKMFGPVMPRNSPWQGTNTVVSLPDSKIVSISTIYCLYPPFPPQRSQ